MKIIRTPECAAPPSDLSPLLKERLRRNDRSRLRLKRLLPENLLWLAPAAIITRLATASFDFPGMLVVKVIIGFYLFLAMAFFYSLLIEKAFRVEPPAKVRNDCIADFTAPIRAFYGIGSDFITTKCFLCSIAPFAGKDVLLFRHGEELRITVDLFHSPRDLGCCVISREELSFFETEEGGRMRTRIACEGFEMLLGQKAGRFLKRTQAGI